MPSLFGDTAKLEEQLEQMRSDLSEMRKDFVDRIVNLERSLQEQIQRLSPPPLDLSQIGRDLDSQTQSLKLTFTEGIQQLHVSRELDQLQTQIRNLSWLVLQLSPDEQETIRKLVWARIEETLAAIDAMGRDHGRWMQQYALAIQSTQQNFDKGQDEARETIDQIRQRFHMTDGNVSDGEERHTDAIQARDEGHETELS